MLKIQLHYDKNLRWQLHHLELRKHLIGDEVNRSYAPLQPSELMAIQPHMLPLFGSTAIICNNNKK
jgi:hypothetical protein